LPGGRQDPDLAAAVRGDHDMNEVKVSKVPGLDGGFRFATGAEIEAHFGCKPGYLGPIGLKQPVTVVADREVAVMADWICGANEADFHLTGVNWGRDLPEPELVADLRNVGRRRCFAGRKRGAGHRARASRWATCSTSAPSTAGR
jgi:prolyl-tRNA synthetase